jgi:hypothetical protein
VYVRGVIRPSNPSSRVRALSRWLAGHVNRSFVANVLAAVFVVAPALGAGLQWGTSIGLVTLGATSGLAAYVLGAD